MIIGFHYHIPIRISSTGEYETESFYGLFLDALASECKELVIFSYEPIATEENLINYTLKTTNITVVSLGLHNTLPLRMLRFLKQYRILKIYSSRLDFFLVRSPTPLILIYPLLIRIKPVVMYIIGDYSESAKSLRLSSIKNILIKLMSWGVGKTQQYLARKELVLTNSVVLYKRFSIIASRVILIKSTTLKREEFFFRADTNMKEPIIVLYTGRIDPSKGLYEIISACEIAQRNGSRIEFHLAGQLLKNLESLPDLLEKAGKSKGVNVIYHGLKRVGPELNALYQQADVYILASTGYEGFPRTIWEAMANGVPVIASKVGSISHFLTDEQDSILTEPGDINGIANGLQKIINDGALRQKLIANAYLLAKENTLDIQARKMISSLTDHFKI